jgi:hypothetical protein
MNQWPTQLTILDPDLSHNLAQCSVPSHAKPVSQIQILLVYHAILMVYRFSCSMDHVLTVVNLASTNLKMFLIIHACLAKKTAALARQPHNALPAVKDRCLMENAVFV